MRAVSDARIMYAGACLKKHAAGIEINFNQF